MSARRWNENERWWWRLLLLLLLLRGSARGSITRAFTEDLICENVGLSAHTITLERMIGEHSKIDGDHRISIIMVLSSWAEMGHGLWRTCMIWYKERWRAWLLLLLLLWRSLWWCAHHICGEHTGKHGCKFRRRASASSCFPSAGLTNWYGHPLE